VFAGGGNDIVNIYGTTGADAFTIDDDVVPAQLTHDKSFSLNGRTYTTRDAENYFLKGMDGDDTFTVAGLGLTSAASTRNVTIEGSNGNDVLLLDAGLTGAKLGTNGAADWVIEGPARGILDGVLRFNTISAIVSNDAPDNVVLNQGAQMPGTTTLPGMDLAGGDNLVSLAGQTGGIVITAATDGTLTMPAGKFAGVDTLIGTLGNDRLVGAAQPNIWNITAANAGTYLGDTNPPLVFSSIESLTGGSSTDTFNMLTGGMLNGSLDGAGGLDTLSYSTLATSVTTNIASAKTTAINGTFTSIETVVGGTALNTLVGNNGTNLWTLTGDNDGTLNGLTFVDYGTLTGGAGTDTFLLGANGAAVNINGSGGTDTLSYAGATGPVNVALTTVLTNGTATRSSAPLNTVTFTNIENHIGSGNLLDTFASTPNGDTIVITGVNAGKVNNAVSFSDYTNLLGGGGNDTFTLQSGGMLTSIDAAGGTGDTLIGANQANVWNVTGAGAGTLNGMAFFNVENLTGGAGVDTFTFAGGSVTGIVTGGSGIDTINFGAGATVSLTNATAGTAAGVLGSFNAIEGLVSSGGTLNGANIASIWRLTALDTGTLNSTTTFSGFGTINGSNTATDRLYVGTGGLSGSFNAGLGLGDVLDYSGVTTISRPYTVSAATLANGSVFDGLFGMLVITGFDSVAGNL
jgi:hypothetical protein